MADPAVQPRTWKKKSSVSDKLNLKNTRYITNILYRPCTNNGRWLRSSWLRLRRSSIRILEQIQIRPFPIDANESLALHGRSQDHIRIRSVHRHSDTFCDRRRGRKRRRDGGKSKRFLFFSIDRNCLPELPPPGP